MKLKPEIKEKIKYGNVLKGKLMAGLDISEDTLKRAVKLNEINGVFTKVRALQIISEELNIPFDDILIDETLKSE